MGFTCRASTATFLIDTLENDIEETKTRMKLILTDIHKLTELCVSKCYFLHENSIQLLENAGPIGFSLMVNICKIKLSAKFRTQSHRIPYYTENL